MSHFFKNLILINEPHLTLSQVYELLIVVPLPEPPLIICPINGLI